MISIIVPIYNAEKYLLQCLESIRNQTYKDIEVLLINDGSTDQSRSICIKIIEIDPRFFLIDETNSGVCYARNRGLSKATGEYVAFIDSDDTIPENYLETLLSIIEKTNSDVVACDFVSDGKRENPDLIAGTFRGEHIFNQFMRGGFSNRIMNKLYRREVIEGIFFPVDRYIKEDADWTARVFDRCNIVVRTDACFYEYRIVPTSLSHKRLSETEEVSVFRNDLTKLMIIGKHISCIADVNYYKNLLESFISDVLLSHDDLSAYDTYENLRKLVFMNILESTTSTEFSMVRKYSSYNDAQHNYFLSVLLKKSVSTKKIIKYILRYFPRIS